MIMNRNHATRFVRAAVTAALYLTGMPVVIGAQWLDHRDARTPRRPDGSANLNAPALRTADGKPDLSGVWQPAPDPTGTRGGIEGIIAPRYLVDITRDLKREDVPFQPAAAALYQQRRDNSFRDNPLAGCLPAGVPRLDAYTHPYKIVQTPELIVVLYESLTMFRQMFVDSRALPMNPEPAWMGYSVGRWDGNALVVETAGFNDKTWLDGSGHPHSEKMRLTERFVRRDFGHMDIEITIDDPVMYTQPLRYTQPQQLLPDTNLLEYVCDNLKELPRTR